MSSFRPPLTRGGAAAGGLKGASGSLAALRRKEGRKEGSAGVLLGVLTPSHAAAAQRLRSDTQQALTHTAQRGAAGF